MSLAAIELYDDPMPDHSDLAELIASIVDDMRDVSDRGRVASYIPSLSRVDPDRFGIAVILADGTTIVGGDADRGFSIQSISKVFALTLALGKVGETLWERVGREPSGSAFNSIVQLEAERGKPRNPFINAGAIVVADVNLTGREPEAAITELLDLVQWISSDDAVSFDAEVARSERDTGERNRALTHFMKAEGAIRHPADAVLATYFHGCAIEMSCRQLANAGRYLMLGGRQPDGARVVSDERARRILSLMLTCGHYDASGDFAYRVGIPGKSGVGGGILAVVPGHASIAVWSPGLDDKGNSKLGDVALERLAVTMGWSVFNH